MSVDDHDRPPQPHLSVFVIGFPSLAIVVRAFDPFFAQVLRLIAVDTDQRLAPQPYDPDLPAGACGANC